MTIPTIARDMASPPSELHRPTATSTPLRPSSTDIEAALHTASTPQALIRPFLRAPTSFVTWRREAPNLPVLSGGRSGRDFPTAR